MVKMLQWGYAVLALAALGASLISGILLILGIIIGADSAFSMATLVKNLNREAIHLAAASMLVATAYLYTSGKHFMRMREG